MLTIDDLKRKTKEKRLTYSDLSEKTGIPESTLKHLFSGRIPNPGYDTVCAIMRALDLDNDTQPPMPDYARVYEALSEHNKILALGYMEGLLNAEGKDVKQIILVSKKTAQN